LRRATPLVYRPLLPTSNILHSTFQTSSYAYIPEPLTSTSYTPTPEASLTGGTEPPERAALRELKEETGYVGTVGEGAVTPALPLSPGLTSETVCMVRVDVNLDAPENANPTQAGLRHSLPVYSRTLPETHNLACLPRTRATVSRPYGLEPLGLAGVHYGLVIGWRERYSVQGHSVCFVLRRSVQHATRRVALDPKVASVVTRGHRSCAMGAFLAVWDSCRRRWREASSSPCFVCPRRVSGSNSTRLPATGTVSSRDCTPWPWVWK